MAYTRQTHTDGKTLYAKHLNHIEEGLVALDADKLDASALPDAVEDALAQAKASGEFDGADGATGADGAPGTSVTIEDISESIADGGENVVTFSDGNTLTVRNGNKGSDGAPGTSVTITKTTVTNEDGEMNTVEFSDGNILYIKNGEKGSTGIAGEIREVTARVNAGVGTPAVTVTEGGVPSSKTLAFTFLNLKGEPGDAGKTAYEYAQDAGYTGTEAQFAAKMAMPIATPEMYGAVGDGSTDDSAAIQAAIDENDYVVIPPGNYAISSAITIPANRKVQLEGRVVVNGECGFVVHGSHIEICGNGKIELPSTNTACTAVRFLADTSVFFVALRNFAIIGSYSTSGVQQQSTAVEIVGGASEGQCSFVEIECDIRSTYRGIYSHAASDQHADSWCTQINIDCSIEQCVKAIDYEWGGDASRIHGEIQPRCNADEAGQTDATLIVLPAYCYFDAMIWDVDTARNNCIMKIAKKYCTMLSVLADKYMDVDDTAVETLVMRKPTHNILTTDGGTFTGNIQFSGKEIGLILEKPDGTKELVTVQENGLVTAGLKNYTNQLPKATDTDRSTIYGGVGYVEGYRLSSSGAVVEHDGIFATGFIPASPGSIVRIKNITVTTAQLLYIIAYDSSNTKTGYAQWNGAGTDTAVITNHGNSLYDMVITLRTDVYGTGFDAIRISSGGFSADTIITVDELIDDSFDFVKSVNGRSGDVELSASDVGALDADTLDDAINTALAEAKASGEFKGDTGETGATGQRGTGLLPVTTAPSSYTTEVGGITPKYRMDISTIKTQAGATEVLLGDTVRYSYYHYPVAYLDASYAYFTTRVSIRGATGAAGAAYTLTDADKTSIATAVKDSLTAETWTFTLADGSTTTKAVLLG